jgi:hypothetical protein
VTGDTEPENGGTVMVVVVVVAGGTVAGAEDADDDGEVIDVRGMRLDELGLEVDPHAARTAATRVTIARRADLPPGGRGTAVP